MTEKPLSDMIREMDLSHSDNYCMGFEREARMYWPRLSAELKHDWKWEYENLKKFATQIEEERDRYKREADLLKDALKDIALHRDDYGGVLAISSPAQIALEALAQADKIRRDDHV